MRTWIAVALMVTVLPACDGTGLGDEEDCPHGVIAVDFPCIWSSYCASETGLVTCRNYTCEEVTGTTCCTGLQCAGSMGLREDCPAGQECFMEPMFRRASCREPDDPEIDAQGLVQYDTHPENCNDMTWSP